MLSSMPFTKESSVEYKHKKDNSIFTQKRGVVTFVTISILVVGLISLALPTKKKDLSLHPDVSKVLKIHFESLAESFDKGEKYSADKIESEIAKKAIEIHDVNSRVIEGTPEVKLAKSQANEAHWDISDAWKKISELRKNLPEQVKSLSVNENYVKGMALFHQASTNWKYQINGNYLETFEKARLHLLSVLDKELSQRDRVIALFVLSQISLRIPTFESHQASNAFLIEIIRELPGTEIALKAYKELSQNIEVGYKGNGSFDFR